MKAWPVPPTQGNWEAGVRPPLGGLSRMRARIMFDMAESLGESTVGRKTQIPLFTRWP